MMTEEVTPPSLNEAPLAVRYGSCLCAVQHFETLFAYYSQSDGLLFGEECREAAGAASEQIQDLSTTDPDIFDAEKLNFIHGTDPPKIVANLARWSSSDAKLPYGSLTITRALLGTYLGTLKFHLMEQLGIPWPNALSFSTYESSLTPTAVRWKPHLSSRLGTLAIPSDELMKSISSERTIAVVGDIRKSQDLMTYAQDADSFSKFMVRFIETTRDLIDDHLGLFDKFTGDGFVAYFSENLCGGKGADFVDCFLQFAKAEAAMCSSLFEKWGMTVRKLPPSPVGLSIGADVGQIDFRDLNNHLVAVGDTIVWAARMSSVGEAGEIIVNNRLHTALRHKPDLAFDDRDDHTKSGEAFKARRLKFVAHDAMESIRSDINAP